MKKIMCAMSGGVDSSVTPLLLKEQGYEVGGAIMELRPGMDREIRQAEAVADRIGIPFFVFRFQEQFLREVVAPFVKTYREGGTPNPCILCNQAMKFGLFLEEAERLGYDGMATGHYASVAYENGRYVLKKAQYAEKDQSYVLYGLTQRQLEKVLFPLGEKRKDDVRTTADEHMFTNSRQKESQDICFIPDGDYASFISRFDGLQDVPGPFTDREGNRLGTHRGMIHYTVGQRKGLGLSLPEPYYVFDKNSSENAVVLCPKREMLVSSFTVRSFRWTSFAPVDGPVECTVRTRYHQKESPAAFRLLEGGERAEFLLDAPSEKPARGQSAVAYRGDYVIGGGIIE